MEDSCSESPSPVLTLAQICQRNSNTGLSPKNKDSKYNEASIDKRKHTPALSQTRNALMQQRLPTGDIPGGRRSNMNRDIAQDLVCTPTVARNDNMASRFPDSLLSSVHAVNNIVRTNPSTPGNGRQRKIQQMQVEIKSPTTNQPARGPIYANLDPQICQNEVPYTFEIANEQYKRREMIKIQNTKDRQKPNR